MEPIPVVAVVYPAPSFSKPISADYHFAGWRASRLVAPVNSTPTVRIL